MAKIALLSVVVLFVCSARADLAEDLTKHLKGKLPFVVYLYTDQVQLTEGILLLNQGAIYGLNSVNVTDVQKPSEEEVVIKLKFYINCLYAHVVCSEPHNKNLYPWFSTSSDNSMTVSLKVKDSKVTEATVTSTELNGIDTCSSCDTDPLYKEADELGTDVYKNIKQKVADNVKTKLSYIIPWHLKDVSV